jgi:hypothetical protein
MAASEVENAPAASTAGSDTSTASESTESSVSQVEGTTLTSHVTDEISAATNEPTGVPWSQSDIDNQIYANQDRTLEGPNGETTGDLASRPFINPHRQRDGSIDPQMGDLYAFSAGDGVRLSAPPGGDLNSTQNGQVTDRTVAAAGDQALNDTGAGNITPQPEVATGIKTGQIINDTRVPDSERRALTGNETPEQIAQIREREAQALRDNAANPNNGMDAQQQKVLNESIDQIMNNKIKDANGNLVDRQPPLTEAQQAELLHQANRMFDPANAERAAKMGLDQKDRNAAVTAMMHDSAQPDDINQGQHNTCNVTTVAKVAAMTQPEKQAQTYVDMFTNANGNSTVTIGGENVRFDANSLQNDRETDRAMTDGNIGKGDWSMFTKGISHAYVNAYTQQDGKGELYVQGTPGQEGRSDTGERRLQIMADGSIGGAARKSDGTVDNSPGMGVDAVAEVSRQVTGNDSMLANQSRFGFRDQSVDNIRNAADLDKAWEANGGKPMIAAVDTSHGMFQATGVGGYGGGHVVTITGRREAGTNPDGTPKYEYQMANSWGDKYDGWVSGDQLAAAMNPKANGTGYSAVPGGDGPPAVPSGGDPGSGGGPRYTPQGDNRPAPGEGAGGGSRDGTGPMRDQDGIKDQTELDKDAAAKRAQEDARIAALESKGADQLTDAERVELETLRGIRSSRRN